MNETVKKIDAYLEQFVGSTMEQMIMQEAKREIEKLIEERDEARREVCECVVNTHWDPRVRMRTNRDIAAYRGWDCFDAKEVQS